jgi:hypothetical protein
LALSELLTTLANSQASAREVDQIRDRVRTIAIGARCSLATQHEVIVRSLLDRFMGSVEAHVARSAPAVEPALVAELVSIDDEGDVVVDERHRHKQPDWSYDAVDSGQAPADRFGDHRAHLELPE